MKLVDLKRKLLRIHDLLSGRPTYLEFVVLESGLYVIQQGEIYVRDDVSLDSINGYSVILDRLEVIDGGRTRNTAESIVFMRNARHGDLFEFDNTAEASGGYILACHYAAVTMNDLDLAGLKNLKGIVVFQPRQQAGVKSLVSHFRGYADLVGIPLLRLMKLKVLDDWNALAGSGISDNRDLIVRRGNFAITASSFEGVVHFDTSRQEEVSDLTPQPFQAKSPPTEIRRGNDGERPHM